jgi:hypothetical protein
MTTKIATSRSPSSPLSFQTSGHSSSAPSTTFPASTTSCSPSQLLITIGPQCAGKTSFLTNYSEVQGLQDQEVLDVSLDNMTRTYEKITVRSILNYQETGIYDLEWERNVYRQTLFQRIQDIFVTEQVPLLLLFTNVCHILPLIPLLTFDR